MKDKAWQTALVLGILLPCLLLLILSRLPQEQEEVPNEKEITIDLQMPDGKVQKMKLETYILGVVLAEMPASFEPAALQAQAVAARTYTLREKRHENADICTDHTCCQAYCAPASYTGGKAALEKVRTAVKATEGQVLTYQGKLIEATYFSCSGGRTEEALAVWGQAVPYLQAVESPGEENAANYIRTQTMTTDAFSLAFGGLTGAPQAWVGQATYTKGGGVDTIMIGGKSYKGTQVRQKLGLKSTAFALTVIGSTVTVTTKGSGHRVGMSQYGADAMAAGGKTYEEILSHYYIGTVLEGIDKAAVLG